MLDTRYLVLDTRYFVLDTRNVEQYTKYLVLYTVYQIFYTRHSILYCMDTRDGIYTVMYRIPDIYIVTDSANFSLNITKLEKRFFFSPFWILINVWQSRRRLYSCPIVSIKATFEGSTSLDTVSWSSRTLTVAEMLSDEPLELRMRHLGAQLVRYPVLVDHPSTAQDKSAAVLRTVNIQKYY